MNNVLHHKFELSTDNIAPRDRTEWFSHQFSTAYYPVLVQPVGDSPLSIHSSTHVLGDVSFSFNSLSPHQATSTRVQTSNAPDTLMIFVKLSGNPYDIRHDRDEVSVKKGQGLIHRVCGDLNTRSEASASSVYMRLPSNVIGQISSKTYQRNFLVVPENQASLELLVRYLSILKTQDIMPNDVARVAREHIIDLSALVVGAVGDVRHQAFCRGVMAARLQVAREFIDQALFDPHLNDEVVAKHLGVTPRYVRKLFESTEAGGCAAYIKQQRLRAAKRIITSPSSLDKKIIDIAFSCGFNDIGTFNRLFKSMFGMSPSELRRS